MTPFTPKQPKVSKAKTKHAAAHSGKQKEGRKKDKESLWDVQEDSGKQVGVKDPWPEPNHDELFDDKESEEEVEVIEDPNKGKRKKTPRKSKAKLEEPEKEEGDKEDKNLDFSDVEVDPVNGIGFLSNHGTGCTQKLFHMWPRCLPNRQTQNSSRRWRIYSTSQMMRCQNLQLERLALLSSLS